MNTEITRLQRIRLNCQCLVLACLQRKWNVAALQLSGLRRATLA